MVGVDAHSWRVGRVEWCGPDEVEVVFVRPDDSDQLVLNLHTGQTLERVA